MSWGKLDDQLHRNKKLLQVSVSARWMHTCGNSRAFDERDQTGFLSEPDVRSLLAFQGLPAKVVKELVGAGFWEPVEGGWLIHDFEEYVPKTSAERTRKWREAKRHRDADVTSPVSHHGVTGDASSDVSRAHTHTGGNPESRSRSHTQGGFVERVSDVVTPYVNPASSSGFDKPDERLVAIARRYQDRSGRPLSPLDLEWLTNALFRCTRLSTLTALAAIDDVADKHLGRGKPVPSIKYWAARFDELDHLAADEGAPPRAARRHNGMTHISDTLGGDAA